MRPLVTALATAAACLVAGAARADIVHLKTGRSLEGTVEDQGENVRVATAAGVVTLRRDEIERIEKTKSAAEIYREKLAALPAADAEAAYQLALWCREQGLAEEHLGLIQRTLTLNRRHAGALNVLRRLLIQTPLKPEPERAAALQKTYGPGFAVKQTGHFLIVSNCDEDYINGRAALLERLYSAFYGYFYDGDFPLMPLRQRLVTLVFASRQEFMAYSRLAVPEAALAAGYYHPQSNQTVFFSAYSDDQVKAARQSAAVLRRLIAGDQRRLPALQRELVRARGRGDRAAVAQIEGAIDRAARRQEQVRDLDAAVQQVINYRVSIVLHETTHQLVFNTGLLRNPPGDPRWLHEGLAMLFESARDGQWRGLATPNTERLHDYRTARKARTLPPLRAILTEQEAFFQPRADTQAYYAGAWGLLYYLSQRHREALNDYLTAVAKHRAGPVTAEARLKDFTDAFGENLDQLDADWRAFMDRVQA